MKVKKITLHNFRIYKGTNTVDFNTDKPGNLTLIAGKNGYGKTTFLTALVWGFYGKLMSKVEDKYRKDIKNANGYENFLNQLFSNAAKSEVEAGKDHDSKLYVEIELTDLLIPSIPCKSIIIKRSYDLETGNENLSVLIDGDENELTKEVGYELFINDFILPREIAKFFFFDAEKIVTLAEARSKSELQSLSKAYSEVLGIKKYEELKKNLESLLTKLKRNGVTNKEAKRLKELIDREQELIGLIDYNQNQQDDKDVEINSLKYKIDDLQEKLIREGSAITLEELNNLQRKKEKLQEQSIGIKAEFKKLLELAPLVIAGKQLLHLNAQLELESKIKQQSIDPDILKKELDKFSNILRSKLKNLEESVRNEIENSIAETIKENEVSIPIVNEEKQILLNFSEEQFRNFQVLLKYLKTSYKDQFEKIVKEDNDNKTLLSNLKKKIKEAEARKGNPLAKKIRKEKEELEKKQKSCVNSRDKLIEEYGELRNQLNRQTAIRVEYEKEFKLQEKDKKKYKTTKDLLVKITDLISRIKENKKYSLQKSVALGLTRLMHKENFINDVKIDIQDDVMDIKLFDRDKKEIKKDGLSKGEQQLYATALLKALVDESGINFPVFIDSPLQKFDKLHSEKIIREFYPTISDQVVLFPLLEKELSENEFRALEPNLNKIVQIENSEKGSTFRTLKKNQLFPVI